jgi:anti-sigma B factor antagonist
MGVQIGREQEGDAVVVAVRGDLDLDGGEDLRAALRQAMDEDRARRIVVDLEGVDFMDSAGLGVLVGGRERARGNDGDLVLVATGRSVLRVLALTGLDRVFEIFSGRREALRKSG